MMGVLPDRRLLRLSGYDYSTAGAYFVTVCTKDRQCILSCIRSVDGVGALHEAPAVELTELGRWTEEIIRFLPQRYPGVSISKYIIMPNHIHLLVEMNACAGRALREAPLREERTRQEGERSCLAKMIGYLKMNVSKRAHQRLPGIEVWQTRYHDHIIRNYDDFLRIWQYIEDNPAKWAEDRYYTP